MNINDAQNELMDEALGLKPIPPLSAPADCSEAFSARDFAVVMSYDAMRICLGLPTKHHAAETVIRWMETMAAQPQNSGDSSPSKDKANT